MGMENEQKNIISGATNKEITSNISSTNPDGSSYTYSGKQKNDTITISFKKEGMRYGELTITDIAGNYTKLSIYANLDFTKPICKLSSVSNEGETSGITANLSCSDTVSSNLEKCAGKNATTSTHTGLKSTQTYNAYDYAGNKSDDCVVKVRAQEQARTQSCSTGKRCSSAGCEKESTCTSSKCCGTHQEPYTCYGSWTSWSRGHCHGHYPSDSSTHEYDCMEADSYGICDGQKVVCNERTRSRNTCYKTVPNRCTDICCGCDLYNEDIGICGCASWGSFGPWFDVNSCSSGESNSHHTNTECRTIYFHVK